MADLFTSAESAEIRERARCLMINKFHCFYSSTFYANQKKEFVYLGKEWVKANQDGGIEGAAEDFKTRFFNCLLFSVLIALYKASNQDLTKFNRSKLELQKQVIFMLNGWSESVVKSLEREISLFLECLPPNLPYLILQNADVARFLFQARDAALGRRATPSP